MEKAKNFAKFVAIFSAGYCASSAISLIAIKKLEEGAQERYESEKRLHEFGGVLLDIVLERAPDALENNPKIDKFIFDEMTKDL